MDKMGLAHPASSVNVAAKDIAVRMVMAPKLRVEATLGAVVLTGHPNQ